LDCRYKRTREHHERKRKLRNTQEMDVKLCLITKKKNIKRDLTHFFNRQLEKKNLHLQSVCRKILEQLKRKSYDWNEAECSSSRKFEARYVKNLCRQLFSVLKFKVLQKFKGKCKFFKKCKSFGRFNKTQNKGLEKPKAQKALEN
jgi:hypothetical protein